MQMSARKAAARQGKQQSQAARRQIVRPVLRSLRSTRQCRAAMEVLQHLPQKRKCATNNILLNFVIRFMCQARQNSCLCFC